MPPRNASGFDSRSSSTLFLRRSLISCAPSSTRKGLLGRNSEIESQSDPKPTMRTFLGNSSRRIIVGDSENSSKGSTESASRLTWRQIADNKAAFVEILGHCFIVQSLDSTSELKLQNKSLDFGSECVEVFQNDKYESIKHISL
ncbi:MAG: hypothetical protein MHMPM18_000347 [Marteilia pararefringens]